MHAEAHDRTMLRLHGVGIQALSGVVRSHIQLCLICGDIL